MYLNVADANKMTTPSFNALPSAPASTGVHATNGLPDNAPIPRIQTRSTLRQQAQNVNAPDTVQVSVMANSTYKHPLVTEVQDEHTDPAKRRRIRLIGTESRHDIRFITKPNEPAKPKISTLPIEHVGQAAYDQNLLSETEARFESAIEKGDISAVQKYLETGEINQINSAEHYLLSALRTGRSDMIRLMLQYVPQLEKPRNFNFLIKLTKFGNAAIFDAFLHKDAIYPEPGKNNSAVTLNPQELKLLLGAVVQSGNADILNLLMRRGLVVDPANRDVVATVIHMAVNSGRYVMLEMLLAETGRLNIRWPDEKMNWLKAAIQAGSADTIKTLIKKLGRDYYSKAELDEHLLFAVERNYVKGAQTLIEGCNADIAARNAKGRTQLMIAAANGNAEMCQLFFYHDAPTDDVDFNGNTVLMHAVTGGNSAIVDHLIDAAVDLHVKNNKGQNVLDIVKLVMRSTDVMGDPEKFSTFKKIESRIRENYDIPLSDRRAAYNFTKF